MDVEHGARSEKHTQPRSSHLPTIQSLPTKDRHKYLVLPILSHLSIRSKHQQHNFTTIVTIETIISL